MSWDRFCFFGTSPTESYSYVVLLKKEGGDGLTCGEQNLVIGNLGECNHCEVGSSPNYQEGVLPEGKKSVGSFSVGQTWGFWSRGCCSQRKDLNREIKLSYKSSFICEKLPYKIYISQLILHRFKCDNTNMIHSLN